MKLKLMPKKQLSEQNISEIIFRCKVDSRKFFAEEELLAHLREKHSESYEVQRIAEESSEPVKAKELIEPVKAKRPNQRKKTEASTIPESQVTEAPQIPA